MRGEWHKKLKPAELSAEMRRRRRLSEAKNKPLGGLHYVEPARRQAIMEKVRAAKTNNAKRPTAPQAPPQA